jgi:undecaprenyl phosphate-alpha-L-ara4FN deformylase
VPALLGILERRGVRATIYFSAGPDNTGRLLWKLLTSRRRERLSATLSAYGPQALLAGTAWPGPLIGPRCRVHIKAAHEAGHEVGVHAWDHYAWQYRLDRMSAGRMASEHGRAHEMIAGIIGEEPVTAAAPGWMINGAALESREDFGYAFASDCRGRSVFRPVVKGRSLITPQVPSTLPTFDELTGSGAIAFEDCNRALVNMIRPDALNVHTVHAEVEGMTFAEEFDGLLAMLGEREIEAVPLGELLPDDHDSIPAGGISRGVVSGRAGLMSVQSEGVFDL